jgi:multiple sugar transport system substrate-binding protein
VAQFKGIGRLAAVAAAAALLTACGSGSGAGNGAAASSGSQLSKGPVTLQMVWWGNDARAQATQSAIAAFEKKYPNITVQTQSLPYDGYHDKLSTQIAANDAPDVMQLQGEFMTQYGNQGALLPLTNVKTDKLDPGTLKNGNIDGHQVAVPTGLSTLAIVADPALFQQAGVAMPNDETWTWDDFAKVAKEISDKSGGKVRGTKSLGWDVTEAETWVQQRGHYLFTKDGKVGASTDDIASLYTFAKKLVDSGAAPSASESQEQLTLAPEQSGVATGRYAMQLDGVSNFPALQNAAGGGLKLLRLPSKTGKKGDAHMSFVASQYWAASSRTKHPAEAQALIDFLSNSVDAGKILGVSRSTPANSAVRDAVAPSLTGADKDVTDYMTEVSKEVVPTFLAPAGAATFTANFQRYTMEVLFGRQTPTDAAKGLLDETKSGLGQ